MDSVPHLAWPLRYTPNGYGSVEQDTVDELAANVGVICSFPLGFRDEAPEFGIEDPEFDGFPLDLTDVTVALAAYEPRAAVNIVTQPPDPLDPGAARVRIEVSMPGGEDEPTSVEV
jgi:phage baseplate assembly protein W